MKSPGFDSLTGQKSAPKLKAAHGDAREKLLNFKAAHIAFNSTTPPPLRLPRNGS